MELFKINTVVDGKGDICGQLSFWIASYFIIMLFGYKS